MSPDKYEMLEFHNNNDEEKEMESENKSTDLFR